MAQTTFSFGNKELTITAGNPTRWEREGQVRDYYDITVEGKANPVRKLYEVISGSTRDHVLEIDGRSFAYEYGFCDSKSKRRAADEAVATLAAQIVAQ